MIVIRTIPDSWIREFDKGCCGADRGLTDKDRNTAYDYVNEKEELINTGAYVRVKRTVEE